MRYSFAVLLLGLLAVPAASGQKPGEASPENDRGWIAVGLGRGVPFGGSGAVTANFGRAHVLQLGVHGTGEVLGGSHVSAFSISLGRSLVDRIGRVAVFAGPTIAWGRGRYDRVEQEREAYATVGLDLSAQAIFTPIKEMGIGAIAT